MASVDTGNNPNDPNNPNNQPGLVNQPGQQSNQPATTSGAGGVTATGAGNVTGQVVGTNNPSQPFQNISSYLAANAPQSKDLAQQVAGTVSAPITAAQTGITNAAQDFTQSVNAGFTPANKDLTTAVSQNPAYVVAENPDNVTNFLAQLNNSYKGPTDFTQQPGYSDIQSKIAQAQAQANNTQNESGIQSLLGAVEGPTTAGNNKLDSLLLSMNPENYKTIQDAGAPAAGLAGTLNQTTTDQNALAAQGSQIASQTVADALAALNTARGNVSTTLGGEQKAMEQIVNDYNQSVGIINPVVANITSAIANFLANNPNIKLGSSGDPMADLENIANITMPELATYASPEDYAQISALMQLGDSNVGNLPISSATSGQAQSFQVPTQLMDALGKAPGVEQALQGELGGFGNQINSAIAPYQQATRAAYDKGTLFPELQTATKALKQQQQIMSNLQASLQNGGRGVDRNAIQKEMASQQQAVDKAQAGVDAVNAKIKSEEQALGAPMSSWQGWEAVGPIAQGLQWVNQTSTNYEDLINAINAELGKLGAVGVPTLGYGPSAAPSVTPGAPIGQKVVKDIGDTANLAALGATGAAGVGSGLLMADAGSTAAGMGIMQGLGPAAGIGAGLQTAATVLPAAGLAAYGASNLAQNINDEYNKGITPGRLAKDWFMFNGPGINFMTLPPQIFKSIGKDISNVINSIGDFFGGLF